MPDGHTGQVVDPQDKSHDWVEVKHLVAAGLLEPGTQLTPREGRWSSRCAFVRDDGRLEVDGQMFDTPSGAGRFVKGSVTNGWAFWRLPDGRRLVDVRAPPRREPERIALVGDPAPRRGIEEDRPTTRPVQRR